MNDDYIFFWGGIYSQWYHAPFVINDIGYNCAEQYMMARKAFMFDDYSILHRIMQTPDPKEQKALGRKVHGFDATAWSEVATMVVFRGNLAKFSQNDNLKAAILQSDNKIIVEASPYDKIWGIGLAEDDPKRFDQENWLGKNLLGQVLMEVRGAIRDAEA